MNELFFGRKKEIDWLSNEFFVTTPGKPYCCSLIGPNDIGKTMLVRKLAEEFEAKKAEKAYYFYHCMVVEKENFLWNFWSSIVKKMANKITEEKLQNVPEYQKEKVQQIKQIYSSFADSRNCKMTGNDIREKVEELFGYYTDIGIHILLVIDEFDLARVAYPDESQDGSFFQHFYRLSPKGGSSFWLSIMLVSRRHVVTIAHHMEGGSSLMSAYESTETTLRGFSDEELEEYYESYRELDCGIPSEQDKRGIHYFCGRHPGLLMKVRRKLKYCKKDSGEFNLENTLDAAMDIYDRMITLMKEECVDDGYTKNCIGPFAQLFIGPAYDQELPVYATRIFNKGFLTRLDRECKSLEELVGKKENGGAYRYEPLSPYFVEYFKNFVLPQFLDATQELLSHAELKIRGIILKVLKEIYPDTYLDVLMRYAPNKDAYLDNLRHLALNRNAERNLFFTKLDVMAFHDYSRIIEDYWTKLQPYLSSYQTVADMKEDFHFLNTSRNCYAHNNQRILTADEVQRLEVLCRKLCSDIEAGEKGIVQVQNGVPVGNVETLLGQQMTFCQGRKKVRANNRFTIQGMLKGTAYRATIGANEAMQMAPPYDREIQVVVEQWDSNGEIYKVRPV